jgi:hypothetical protein
MPFLISGELLIASGCDTVHCDECRYGWTHEEWSGVRTYPAPTAVGGTDLETV